MKDKEVETINLRVNLILSTLDNVDIGDALITITTCYQVLIEEGIKLGMKVEDFLKTMDTVHNGLRKDIIQFDKKHSINPNFEMNQ